jgi:hypothetical protein
MEFIFFLLFAVVLTIMYLSIRRGWMSPGLTAFAGVIASIVTMSLFVVARGNSILQGVVTGVFIGVIFAVATLAIAWYFRSSELRAQYANADHYTGHELPPEEYYE